MSPDDVKSLLRELKDTFQDEKKIPRSTTAVVRPVGRIGLYKS